MPRVTTSPSFHAQTPHSFSPCPPAQLALRTALSANVLSCLLEKKETKHEEQIKIRHHMLFLAKLYEVKVWHSDGSNVGWRSYTGTVFATCEKVMTKDKDFPLSPNRCPLSCGTARWCTSPPCTSDSVQRPVPAGGRWKELLEREKKLDDRWKKAVAAMMSG